MFSGTVLKFVDQLGQGWHVSALTVETVWHKYFLPMQQKYLSPLVSVLTAQNSQKSFIDIYFTININIPASSEPYCLRFYRTL